MQPTGIVSKHGKGGGRVFHEKKQEKKQKQKQKQMKRLVVLRQYRDRQFDGLANLDLIQPRGVRDVPPSEIRVAREGFLGGSLRVHLRVPLRLRPDIVPDIALRDITLVEIKVEDTRRVYLVLRIV